MARKGKVDPAVTAAAKTLGRLGGTARARALTTEAIKAIAQKGGQARAKALSVNEKRAIARRAARSRWPKGREARPS